MSKAEKVFKKLAGFGEMITKGFEGVGKALERGRNVVKGEAKALNRSKIVSKKAPIDLAKEMGAKTKDHIAQVSREIQQNRLTFEGATKKTMGQKIKAEKEYLAGEQRIHQAVIAKNGRKPISKKIGKASKGNKANVLIGMGAVGATGVGYVAGQNSNQRNRGMMVR